MSIPPEDAAGALAGAAARYAGEPQYPDPWTTKNPKESLRDDGGARLICLSPDVCLTPMGSSQVPVPYMISDRCDHPINYSTTVFHNGRRVLLLRSKTQHVEGDEPGTGGGVKSGVNRGVCEPIDHAEHYRIEGSPVVRHLDRFWMNNRNTIGEAQHAHSQRTYDAPEEDDPLPGSLRYAQLAHAQPQTVNDAGFSGATAAARPAPLPDTAPPPRSPAPGNNVIRPDFPQWRRPPPVPESPVSIPNLLRYGRWGAAALAAGAVLLTPTNKANLSDVVPQDDFEGEVTKEFEHLVKSGADSWEARKWALEEINAHRAEKTEGDKRPATENAPPVKNTRIDDEKERCGIRKHSENKDKCPENSQSHHGMIHFPFRTGTQTNPGDIAPGAPEYDDAYTFCIPNDEHTDLHKKLNTAVNEIGKKNNGMITYEQLLELVENSIDRIKDSSLSKECKEIYKKTVRNQNKMKLDANLRGRLRPTKDVIEELKRLWGVAE